MTCEELLELLLDYVGGDLVIELRETVEVHIATCQNCTIRIETYRHTVRLARALPKCGMSPAFEERLRKAVEPHMSSENG